MPQVPSPGRDAPTLRLYPTDAHVERALCGARGEGALLAARFVVDAAASCLPHERPASPETSLLAAEAALDDVPGRARAGSRALAVSALDRALGYLRRAGASPERLAEVDTPGARRLAAAMASVDAQLARAGLYDARGAGARLAAALASGRPDSREEDAGPPGRPLVVECTARFEADDLAWLEALHARRRARGERGVTLALPEGRICEPAFAPVAALLEGRWAALDDAPEIAWVEPRRLGEAPGALPSEERLRVVEARDAEGEARAAVREVLEALGRGARLDRIGIVVPALDDATLDPLRASLDDARLPFCEPRGRSPLGTGEGRALFAMLELARGPILRDRILELLRAPGLSLAAYFGGPEAAARVRAERLARRVRELPIAVDRTGERLLETLEARVAGVPEEAWMPRGLRRLLADARELGAEASRRMLGLRLLAWMDRVGLGRPSAAELAAALRAEEATGLPALGATGEGVAAARALRGAVERSLEASRLLGLEARQVELGDLEIELEIALARGFRGPGAGSGAIRLLRASEAAGSAHDLLVVLGLEAGAYGGRAEALPQAFDGTLQHIARALALPSPALRRAAGQAELAWAVAASGSAVLLSHAADDEAPRRHPLVQRALAWGAPLRREPASRLAPAASRVDARAAELARARRGASPPRAVLERVRIEAERAAFFADPRAEAGPFTGRVVSDGPGREALAEHLRACVGGHAWERPIAVTHIERAVGCSFAAFARRVLRARRDEDAAEAPDARERGTLVHQALCAVFEAVRELDPDAGLEARLAVAREAAERSLAAASSASPLRREGLARAVAEALRTLVWSSEDPASASFTFALAERRFAPGEPQPWGPLEIPPSAPGGPSLFVDGQIDRIDLSPDRRAARVVDYKTGYIPTAAEQGASALQLPLYAAVVARAYGCAEMEAHYVAIDPAGEVWATPSRAEARRAIAEKAEAAMGVARRAVGRLHAGDFAPRPQKSALCGTCDARDVCRRPASMPTPEPAGSGAAREG